MLVHKFGGTSVADAARIGSAAQQVVAQGLPAVVVSSAMAGVTDLLISLAEHACARRTADEQQGLAELRRRHLTTAEELSEAGPGREALLSTLRASLLELEQLLHGVRLLQELSPRSLDLISSFGERLAAPLLAAAIDRLGVRGQAEDARGFIRTDASFGRAVVDLTASRELSRTCLLAASQGAIPVVTGFIGATADGVTTTLGRGGSDYSAALLGAFLDAREICIWTDVDGVLTADPRVVPEARLLETISYREAAEMAYFGSKVLHPSTMTPAVRAGIPIRIRNSLRPELAGTLIAGESSERFEGVKTVTSIAAMALVTVEGRGMIGVPGVVGRLFAATARAEVNVFMISQASSEQNISFLVRQEDGARVLDELEREFEFELERRRIDRIDLRAPVGILAIIGEGMRGTPGVSQKLFTALGRARVNVLAIAQGSSELNVSVVVDEAALHRAVGATHSAFGLTRDTHVFLLGKGAIARALLRQLVAGRERLETQHGLSLKVVGVAGSTEWLFDPRGLGSRQLQQLAEGVPLADLGAQPRPDDADMIEQLTGSQRLDTVLVDLTAAETAELHASALRAGLHVVTANKKPLAGSMVSYRAIRQAATSQGVGFHFEATFGAGLPLLFTLQDLLATRDEILGITGCFSGTLGFICTELQKGRRLSEIVLDARARGYTEPDPRDDLGGLDVARKALIIAREIGLEIEMAEVELESLVTPELMALSGVEAFMDRLHELDGPMAERVARADDDGKVLRYLVEIEPGGVRVGLWAVERASPAGQLDGPDNIITYRTERYRDYPLSIRGPGAGAEVTAAGVFGDILKVARRV